jgi:peptidoglycan-N-acetylglucosamine deacetylase
VAAIDAFDVDRRVVSLTFDDGPAHEFTELLLRALDAEGVLATFFVLGSSVTTETRRVVQATATAGHDIGNHTFNHRSFEDPALDDALASEEIHRTHELLEEITGVAPNLIRPPYGRAPDRVDRLAARFGYRATIMFRASHEDWLKPQPPACAIVNSVISDPTFGPGSIVLLHDGCDPRKSGDSRLETVKAVQLLIPLLREQGYDLAPISQLLDETGVA